MNESETQLSKSWQFDLVVGALIVVSATLIRIGLQPLAGLSPVAGFALFGAFYFRHTIAAAVAPVAAMLVSDWAIMLFTSDGHYPYHPLVLLSVYLCVLFPLVWRLPLREYLRFGGESLTGQIEGFSLALVAAFSGTVFHWLSTNAAHWYADAFGAQSLYHPTWASFFSSFVLALPFERMTLFGDLLFAAIAFGLFAFASNLAWQADAASDLQADLR